MHFHSRLLSLGTAWTPTQSALDWLEAPTRVVGGVLEHPGVVEPGAAQLRNGIRRLSGLFGDDASLASVSAGAAALR